MTDVNDSSPVSLQTQLLALRKRKPQETQALALASSQSRLPLLRPSIPSGWLLRLCLSVINKLDQLPARFQHVCRYRDTDID